jgi:hypothetical protein
MPPAAAGAKPIDPDMAHGSEGHRADETVRSIPPRLLDLKATAAYLGVSPWTVRDLEFSGVLQRVNIPLGPRKELRKLLFDRLDLDRLVETWKGG